MAFQYYFGDGAGNHANITMPKQFEITHPDELASIEAQWEAMGKPNGNLDYLFWSRGSGGYGYQE